MVTVLHSVRRWLPRTETWLYNQVRYLPDGVENHIVCGATENLDQFWLPNIHSLSTVPRWRYRWRYSWNKGLRKSGLLVEQARRHRAQVLHSHFGGVGWVDLGAARHARLKHVVTFYGWDVGQLPNVDPLWRKRYRDLFERVDLVLCEGPHMARSVVGLGCPKHKVRVHHLGVGVDEIAFKPRVWTPDEPLRVLIAASFREKKGIPYALEALGRMQHDVPLKITVIGNADHEERNRVEKQRILGVIEKYGLQPKVRMLGYQPHDVLIEEAYKHHVFLSPSVKARDGDTEGGAPISIIEMAASGMPVVSTRHCDIPEVVRDGVTGLLADEGDVEGLVSRLRWLAEHPQCWRDMLEAGRRHVEARYDARTQARDLAQVYEDVLS
jgi:colanic acid/amylovoran biosynthesis glycosyltransferase